MKKLISLALVVSLASCATIDSHPRASLAVAAAATLTLGACAVEAKDDLRYACDAALLTELAITTAVSIVIIGAISSIGNR